MPSESDFAVELVAIEISNLRGFRNARLRLREGFVLLVGPNNSGKTSILRILDWILNQADERTLRGEQLLSEDELQLLVPARRTGGAARRITLTLDIPDGRRRRRFRPVGDDVLLRIGVTADGRVRLNVGQAKRAEDDESAQVIELLREVRKTTEFGLVPASRDASSRSFQAAFRDAVTAKLEERAIHARQAGAPAEYRKVKKSLAELESIGGQLVAPLWDEMRRSLPAGLAREGRLQVSFNPEDFIPWLADRVSLRLVTGSHDTNSVVPIEVGSGLQSLLELATQQAASSTTGGSRILAIEEPEAFLHPSAQRTLARLIAGDLPGKRLVSTHSPLLVEEALYGDIVLVRDHQFYEAAPADDAVRGAINTALLVGHGAEMAFARSVLLVEGEGDKQYFEGLRRRLATKGDGRLDELYVLPTGSKTQFGPWLRLLSSYGRDGDRPVQWLAAPDGDAATDIRRAWADAGLTLPQPVVEALDLLANARAEGIDEQVALAHSVNEHAERRRIGMHLLPGDLEHTITVALRASYRAELGRTIGAPEGGGVADLRTWLGNNKAPWIRAVIARTCPWPQVSPSAKDLLVRWLSQVMSESEAKALIRNGAPPLPVGSR